MTIPAIMDYILGTLIEDLQGTSFQCDRVKGLLIIDASDRSVSVEYLNERKVRIGIARPGPDPVLYQHIPWKEAPAVVLKHLGKAPPKPWWKSFLGLE